jgi:hypothetical protein
MRSWSGPECRRREVVDRNLIQAGVLSDERADSVSQALCEARHRVLLARKQGDQCPFSFKTNAAYRSIFIAGTGLTISQRITSHAVRIH